MANGHLGQVIARVRRLIGADVLAPTTDSQLLGRFQAARDSDAFAELLQRHGPMVQAVCRRILGNAHDADDAFQATFLLFARKAETIRGGTSVAGWLYRVAYRVALRARADSGRRRDLELRAAAMSEPRDSRQVWQDLQPVLDEELQRLPAKYRDSIVVRFLQGKSNEEAARQFGLPPGSMSWRLSRALELLRQRLARRGVTPTSAVLTALLVETATAAPVAADLAAATVQASVLFACGTPAEGAAISVRVFLLVEGGLRAMFLQKLISTAACLVFVLFLGSLGWIGYPLLAEPPTQRAATDATPTPTPVKTAEEKASAGRVVDRGLQWLVRHQNNDGFWSIEGPQSDAAAGTGLALLPFLLVGENHKATGFDHVYSRPVARGLRALVKLEAADGSFGGTMYGQAMAAWALCEAYRQTADPDLKEPAQRAVNFSVNAQNEGGSWGYMPKTRGDTSITTWHITALTCAKHAGLQVPDKTWTAASAYLDSAVSKDGKGYSYVPNAGQATASMTGGAISCRLRLGWKPDHPGLVAGVKLLQNSPPTADGRNVYTYHWVASALKGVGGDAWKQWEAKMRPFLLDSQEAGTGELAGSWSPQGDVFGTAGGRLMITSLSLITLELCAEEELRQPIVTPRALRADEIPPLWDDLAGANTFRVRRSMALLIGDGQHTVAYLKDRLRPTPKTDMQKIERLIADLDSDAFAQRRKAEQELLPVGEFAEVALQKLLDDKPSLELHQRIERLLQRIEERSPETLRPLRAVTILERLGTPESRELLKHLAGGAAEAWQTREAKAALERLKEPSR